MKWQFAEYVLDTDRAELSGPEALVHKERKPFRLLSYLIENADRVVTKDDIIADV